MQRFLAEKVTLAQSSDELLVCGIGLLDCNPHLTSADDKERVSSGALSHDVVAIVVEGL